MHAHRPGSRIVPALLVLAAAIASIAATGCGNSHFVSTWKDPTFTAGPLLRVMVIAPRRSEIQRRVWEDAFVTELAKRGVAATPSYRLFPDRVPSDAELRSGLPEDAFDGLLLVARTGHRIEKTVMPPTVTQAYQEERWDPFTRVYEPAYHEVVSPGYVEKTRVVSFETSLWDLRGPARMIWSGATESMNPEPGNEFAKSLASYVVERVGNGKFI